MANADEISLDAGATVTVVASKPSGWSWVANQNGDTGWFPTQYLAKDKSAVSIKPLLHEQFSCAQYFLTL